jgi:predicted acetyltransferase
MASLVAPALLVHASFLAAMAEFQGEGRGAPDDRTGIGSEIRAYAGRWSTPDGFAVYVSDLRADALEETPRPPHIVPQTTLWWVDGHEYLGRVGIRHRLTESLRLVGGHIGYDVRPSARRQGHATAMLAAALPVARALGIASALLTCDSSNLASRRVIEANGGMHIPATPGDGQTLRFWVPTG